MPERAPGFLHLSFQCLQAAKAAVAAVCEQQRSRQVLASDAEAEAAVEAAVQQLV